jgi:hypothetical protein
VPPNRCRAVVALGQVSVVSGAEKADVGGSVIAAHAEGVSMMELEPQTLAAASAFGVDEGAAALIASVDLSPNGGRDVARARGDASLR